MKVNVFCVGAAKAGTTSIFEALRKLDDVELPIDKEPHYFGEHFVVEKKYTSLAEYHGLYKEGAGVGCRVDFSTSYLYSENAAKEIYEYNPNSKIIIVLRDPVERALSLYNHQRRSMLEEETIDDALRLEYSRIKAGYPYGYHYFQSGLYYKQVKRYFDIFPAENIMVLQFNRLIRKQDEELRRIYAFLNLSGVGLKPISLLSENKTGIPKSDFIQNLFEKDFLFKDFVRSLIPRDFLKYVRGKNIGDKCEFTDGQALALRCRFKADQDNLFDLLKSRERL